MIMRYLTAFTLIFSLILGFFAFQVGKKDFEDFESQLEKDLGAGIFEILSNPDSIRAATAFSTGFATGGSGTEYLLQNAFYRLNAMQAFKIQKLILSPENYVFDKTKKGLFIPTHVLFFEKSNQIVVILISSLLNQMKVVKDEKTIVLDYDPMKEEFNIHLDTLKES